MAQWLPACQSAWKLEQSAASAEPADLHHAAGHFCAGCHRTTGTPASAEPASMLGSSVMLVTGQPLLMGDAHSAARGPGWLASSGALNPDVHNCCPVRWPVTCAALQTMSSHATAFHSEAVACRSAQSMLCTLHTSLRAQDMGHRLDAAAPVQRRKHWEELADTVVSSAYCGEASGVDAGSLREPAATSKVGRSLVPQVSLTLPQPGRPAVWQQLCRTTPAPPMCAAGEGAGPTRLRYSCPCPVWGVEDRHVWSTATVALGAAAGRGIQGEGCLHARDPAEF